MCIWVYNMYYIRVENRNCLQNTNINNRSVSKIGTYNEILFFFFTTMDDRLMFSRQMAPLKTRFCYILWHVYRNKTKGLLQILFCWKIISKSVLKSHNMLRAPRPQCRPRNLNCGRVIHGNRAYLVDHAEYRTPARRLLVSRYRGICGDTYTPVHAVTRIPRYTRYHVYHGENAVPPVGLPNRGRVSGESEWRPTSF